MNSPYNGGTSFNQSPTMLQQYVTVGAVGATLYGGAKTAQAVGEGVKHALGYGPAPESNYRKVVGICSDILTITGAAALLLEIGYYAAYYPLKGAEYAYDAIFGDSSKKETQATNASAAAKSAEPARDPAYLNSRRS